MVKNIQLYYAPQSLRQEAQSQDVYAWRTIIHLNLLRSMRLVIDTLSQANKESISSFADGLCRLFIKLSPLKQAEELLMKISPQEEGNSQVVVTGSTESAVRSTSGWKQEFDQIQMRMVAAAREGVPFDNGLSKILETCSKDMIGL
jgi:hypothetical protein